MEHKKVGIWKWGFLVFLILGSIWILSQHKAPQTMQESRGKIFGTYYTMKYESAVRLDSLIQVELKAVDQSLSMFNPSSTIARINRGEVACVDSSFARVFHLSQEIARQTVGAFDITVAPLVNIWGFGLKNAENVSPAKIDSILDFVGYGKVTLEDGKILKADERLQMDLSAVAKGYGVDQVARLFNRQGIENYMVEIGGEIVVKGKNAKGKPWVIEITRPTEEGETAVSDKILLAVSDIAMATSGNYRRFYVKDGKRYAHTIDGKTGYPVQHSLLSATVLAADCAAADAYATAFMVMGVEGAKQFLQAHPELAAYLIYSEREGELSSWYSPSMEPYMIK